MDRTVPPPVAVGMMYLPQGRARRLTIGVRFECPQRFSGDHCRCRAACQTYGLVRVAARLRPTPVSLSLDVIGREDGNATAALSAAVLAGVRELYALSQSTTHDMETRMGTHGARRFVSHCVRVRCDALIMVWALRVWRTFVAHDAESASLALARTRRSGARACCAQRRADGAGLGSLPCSPHSSAAALVAPL